MREMWRAARLAAKDRLVCRSGCGASSNLLKFRIGIDERLRIVTFRDAFGLPMGANRPQRESSDAAVHACSYPK
jgi:hypothetical protein